ncbi:Na+/H+ antiporter NhaC family protein [Sedimentibacter saalensis]|uniref:Na+/H+ antiporter NhaC family protein n=1 Tax=Sedimentibacter saalensis TaxID=130788 RepID=UPI00289D6E69|nr:Na+/H+ antiporter NhaC family protein [Sedimentibacter saalensis]
MKQNNPAVKTFLSAAIVLIVMLFLTGLLTYVIPNGDFNAETMTFTEREEQGIPILTWIGAPILVLFSESGALVIAIILFLLIIGGSIHLLKETGLIEGIILAIVKKFKDNEFALLCMLVFVFMALGAFIGVFEEVVPLVPLIIILARRMGWDELTGLGVSVLATGLGFAAAVTNPFTIGVAQGLAGIPIFSGALLRLLVFISVYVILVAFLFRRTKKNRIDCVENELTSKQDVSKKAYVFFIVLMLIMFMLVGATPFVEALRDYTLPLIGVIFLMAGIGVGLISNWKPTRVSKQFFIGAKDMSPAIILILLATGIKHVMIEGHILDTILYQISQNISHTSPLIAVFIVFIIVMIMNFFIGSGSAKAFILMPILVPIMDLLGIGRQLGILAFQFGDGFSNVLYPTNAVLLISLGLVQVGYGKWIKFILPLQGILMLLSLFWLAVAFTMGYGL